MFHQASDREAVYACFTFSHWLVYANSAANPIIYDFLSGEWAGQAEWRRAATVPQDSRPPPPIRDGWGYQIRMCSFLGIMAPLW